MLIIPIHFATNKYTRDSELSTFNPQLWPPSNFCLSSAQSLGSSQIKSLSLLVCLILVIGVLGNTALLKNMQLGSKSRMKSIKDLDQFTLKMTRRSTGLDSSVENQGINHVRDHPKITSSVRWVGGSPKRVFLMTPNVDGP